jgi:predicted RNase H-like HicB family nuclease
MVVYHAEYGSDTDSGGYWASVKELPGCITQAETLAELREMVTDAIRLYLSPRRVSFEIELTRAKDGRHR